jgi:hypothetical protein
MNMPHFLLKAGVAACTLALLGFAPANATPRLALGGAPSLTILAGDEENSEIENYEEPAADNGAPKDETPPEAALPERHLEGENAMAPHPNEGGGSAERALESTVGDDGINAIQRDSIPPSK